MPSPTPSPTPALRAAPSPKWGGLVCIAIPDSPMIWRIPTHQRDKRQLKFATIKL